jgi:hypothetical protein
MPQTSAPDSALPAKTQFVLNRSSESWISLQPSREERKTRGAYPSGVPLRVKTRAGRFPWLWKAKTGVD